MIEMRLVLRLTSLLGSYRRGCGCRGRPWSSGEEDRAGAARGRVLYGFRAWFIVRIL